MADGVRAAGYSVLDLSQSGEGVPDTVIGRPGFACLMEIKDGSKPPSQRRLTPDQERVLKNWTGPYIVVTSVEDALAKIREIDRAP